MDRAAHARLENVFLVIALTWGVAQTFIVPPLQVPDEGDHWFRAWALTDGQLMTEPDASLALPAAFAPLANLYTFLVRDEKAVPPFLDGQPGFTTYEDLFNGDGASGSIRVASRVASYGPVGYLPQAAGIGVGRVIGLSPLASFYLARLANLFVSLGLLYTAIRLAPFGKQLFVLFALLPMTMFELASVSCDALTISGAMFYLGLLLWASRRATLRAADVAVIVGASTVLLNVKPGYEALVLLVLLLTPSQLGGRGRYAAFVALNVLAVVALFLVGVLASGTADRAGADTGAGQHLASLLNEPAVFLGMLLSNVQTDLLKWVLQSIGIVGWLTILLPTALYVFVLVAGLMFFFGMSEMVNLRRWQRALMAAAAVIAFISIGVAVYLFLPIRDGDLFIQGRYLIPLWLLLLLSAYGIRFSKVRLSTTAMSAVLLVVMAWNLQTLASSYHP